MGKTKVEKNAEQSKMREKKSEGQKIPQLGERQAMLTNKTKQKRRTSQ